jgi:hypothetical protein
MDRFLIAGFSVVLLAVAPADAQTLSRSATSAESAVFDVPAPTPEQEAQLTAWLAEVKKWQQYDVKWRNRPVHNGWAQIVDRKPAPPAPEWLAAHCDLLQAARLSGFDERLDVGCRVLDDPRASFAAVPVPLGVAPGAEQSPHTSFFTRLHFDGMWSTTSTHGRIYGLVGTHISLVDIGRVQLFGPPGVMLLTVPDGYGGRRATLGYTWGLSVRLADLRMGAPTRNVTLFLNVSKVFLSSAENGTDSSRGFDIVGFSIAPRKKR